jgi:hypothetical protein
VLRLHSFPRTIFVAFGIALVTVVAYRGLLPRPFAADDYQWLLNVSGPTFGELLRTAFDPSAQTHFYRPLVWLLFWLQSQLFGLQPEGYHIVSLALHLANAGLLGVLAWRLGAGRWGALFAAAFVALHPAPFESVVWVSAQSELLAALLLLVMLHVWIDDRRPTNDDRPTTTDQRRPTDERVQTFKRSNVHPFTPSPLHPLAHSLPATFALALALLAKESAAISLGLLFLTNCAATEDGGRRTEDERPPTTDHRPPTTDHRRTMSDGRRPTISSPLRPYAPTPLRPYAPSLAHLIVPTLLTITYLALQLAVAPRNYLVDQGGYGFGPQIVLNPLRSLALLVAPLPRTEHADAVWLLWVGLVVLLALIGFWMLDFRFWSRRDKQSKIQNLKSNIALLLTLLPTAPFASPPDSRYLYLPVMAFAVILGLQIGRNRRQSPIANRQSPISNRQSPIGRWAMIVVALTLIIAATTETAARENRFAAASGPGGSMWRVVSGEVCAGNRPGRVIVVDPPIATPHVDALVRLACGPGVRVVIVGRAQLEEAIRRRSAVIGFPNGSAVVERRT